MLWKNDQQSYQYAKWTATEIHTFSNQYDQYFYNFKCIPTLTKKNYIIGKGLLHNITTQDGTTG